MAKGGIRRAGARWRVLVHEYLGKGQYGTAYHVQSSPREGLLPTSPGPVDTEHSRTTVLPGTELDEVVVGRWLHLEQMDAGIWWMNVGGVTVHVTADRDGKPTSVRVDGPGDYDDPVPDCRYTLNWTADNEFTAPKEIC